MKSSVMPSYEYDFGSITNAQANVLLMNDRIIVASALLEFGWQIVST